MPLLHLLRQNPVIAAVKDNASLQLAIDSECQFISVLYGNICTISNIVKKIKNAGKYAFIHVDLLEDASSVASGAECRMWRAAYKSNQIQLVTIIPSK